MKVTAQIAKHFREIHFGVNWTWSNLQGQLTDVTVTEANAKIDSFNTIAALAFHINYYVGAILKVLEGGPLNASDQFSFDHPPFETQQAWNDFLQKMWRDAEAFAKLVEQLPDERLWENFDDPKYGSYYRNLHGVIEHSHYHLGQIAILKKLIRLPQ